MNYNIEIQIASLVFVLILTIVMYTKKRYSSIVNTIFRILIAITILELILDIISVIYITKAIESNNICFWTNFWSKFYLITMIAYILFIVIYSIMNTVYDGIPKTMMTVKIVECILCAILFVIAAVIIITNPLLYGGSGRNIYSYGIPSNVVYIFSSISVVYVIILLFANFKKISFTRLVPIISFSLMEGIIALIQVFNKQLLLVGFGSAAVCYIMYFALENPDSRMIDELDKVNYKYKNLLTNIFPAQIADRILSSKNSKKIMLNEVDNVSLMQIGIVNYGTLAKEYGEIKIAGLINLLYSEIDDLTQLFKVEKIRTAGDVYLVAAGVPENYGNSCEEIIRFGKQVLRTINNFNEKYKTNIKVKIGVDCGKVVAGILGKRKFSYDIIGDLIKLVSMYESIGSKSRICISERIYYILGNKYEYEENSLREIKGIGQVKSFFVC